MSKPLIGIVMGSKSDLDIMQGVADTLQEFGVEYEMRVLSAHRTPEATAEFARGAKAKGMKVIIAGAGGSAHLAGVITALTTLPVLSIPVKRDNHDHEALWSNIAMPPGMPLATMPENGGKNAALFAIEILALQDAELAKKYEAFRVRQSEGVLAADKEVRGE